MMATSSGCGLCPWSCSGKVGAYVTITNLPSLESRRHQAKLCHLFKIANAQTYFPDAPLTNRIHHYAVRSSREHSLMPIQFHSNQFGKSYFPNTINAWNSLPSSTHSSTSIAAFKFALNH